jgi:hypothetical protein
VVGCDPRTVIRWITRTGGVRRYERRRSRLLLSLAEREEIALGVSSGRPDRHGARHRRYTSDLGSSIEAGTSDGADVARYRRERTVTAEVAVAVATADADRATALRSKPARDPTESVERDSHQRSALSARRTKPGEDAAGSLGRSDTGVVFRAIGCRKALAVLAVLAKVVWEAVGGDRRQALRARRRCDRGR